MSCVLGDRTDGEITITDDYNREGSQTDDVMVRSSVSRGSSRSTGSKTLSERPPAYGTGASDAATNGGGAGGAGGYVIEESITTDTTTNVMSAADDSMFSDVGRGSGRGATATGVTTVVTTTNASYDEDGNASLLFFSFITAT